MMIRERKHTYGFNGIEYNEDLGANFYEMPLRSYDPTIARWTTQDPVIHHMYSPYSAFDNNPVYWADPSGANGQSPFDFTTLFANSGSGYTRYVNDGYGNFEQAEYIRKVIIGNLFGLDSATGNVSFLSGQNDSFGEGVFDVLNAGNSKSTGFQINSNIASLLIPQRANGTSILSDLAQERTNGLSYSIGGIGEAKDFANVFEFVVANTNTGNGFGIEFGLDVFKNVGGVQIALHTLHSRKRSLNFTANYHKLGIESGIRNSNFFFSVHSHKGGAISPSKNVYNKTNDKLGGDVNNVINGKHRNLSRNIYLPPHKGTSVGFLNEFVKNGRLISYNTITNNKTALFGSRTLTSLIRRYANR